MASINDVADLAGVSVRTVSRYLSGHTGISDKTRARVQGAIDQLHYAPSAAAQQLRGRGDSVVGLITDGITTTPYSYEITAGVQSVCDKNDTMLLIGEVAQKEASFQRVLSDFRRHRCQAILYATHFRRPVNLKFEVGDTPIILVNCYEQDTDRFPTVLPHDEQGAYLATRHLLENGHERIGFLTLSSSIPATNLRNSGYRRAHIELGRQLDAGLIRVGVVDHEDDEVIGNEFDDLENHIRALLGLDRPPTAVLLGNDKMAMRAYMIAQNTLGLSIPKDISLVGYDNFPLIAENLVPPLTTVQLPYFEMGVAAATLALEKQRDPVRHLIDSPPVLRQSTARAAPSNHPALKLQ